MNWGGQYFNRSSQQVYDPDTYYRQIVNTQHLTLQKVLHCVNKCSALRDDPQLLTQIFQNRKNVIEDLIDWMFQPQIVINRNYGKNNKNYSHPQKNKFYRHIPFLCKNWMFQNDLFYQKVIQSAVNNIIPIQRWFSFLYDQNTYFLNSPTFATSMGYFDQAIITLIKNVDLDSINLTISSFSRSQINGSIRSQSPSHSTSFIKEKHNFGSQIFNNKKQKEQIILFGIFKQPLLNKLIQRSYIDGVFKFIHVLCLRCLQDNQKDPTNVRFILVRLFSYFKTLSQKDYAKQQLQAWAQNLLTFLKEIKKNIETDSYKATLFVQVMDQAHLSKMMIQYIIESDYFNDILESNQVLRKLYKSNIQSEQNSVISENSKYQEKSVITRNISLMKEQVNIHDERIVQLLLQCLAYYAKLSIQLICPNINKSIQQIFEKMPNLFFIISQNKIKKHFPFSSGQNITKITLLKHSCMKLLLQTLILFSKYHEKSNLKPTLQLKRSQVLHIVQRYINQNRWNNIVHLTLEKIFEVLNSPYCNIQKNQEINHQFLTFLIESFMNNQYVFLQTCHFAHQGNLHILYKMAKLKARYLNTNQKLLPSMKNFDPWKKFLTNDLNKYEQNLNKNIINVSNQLIQTMNRKSINPSIAIDEVDTIKKILQQVQDQISWQERLQKRRINMMLKSCAPVKNFSSLKKFEKKLSNIQYINKLQLSNSNLSNSNSSQDSMKVFEDSQIIKIFPSSQSLQLGSSLGNSPPPMLSFSNKKSSILNSQKIKKNNQQRDQKSFDKKLTESDIITVHQKNNKNQQKKEIRSSFLKGIQVIKKE